MFTHDKVCSGVRNSDPRTKILKRFINQFSHKIKFVRGLEILTPEQNFCSGVKFFFSSNFCEVIVRVYIANHSHVVGITYIYIGQQGENVAVLCGFVSN